VPFPVRQLVCICCLLVSTAAFSQSTATNRVLKLDDGVSSVELPANALKDFHQATVEAWVKWDRLDVGSRFFVYGMNGKGAGIGYNDWGGLTSEGLTFWMWEPGRKHDLTVPIVLKAETWHHVAAVSGPGGMKLYLDGVLVQQDPYTGSFAEIGNGDMFSLGRSLFAPQTNFRGELDEVRVWNVERTPAEITAAMLTPLTESTENFSAALK
jgi:hypothetical protein